ncbi:MAG: hypothetical protein ACR2PH_01910, partial [Desulfobulbia bacterium]
MKSTGIALPNGKNLSRMSSTAAIIVAALLAFLIIMPTPGTGGLFGLVSLFQAIVLAGIASLFVTW